MGSTTEWQSATDAFKNAWLQVVAVSLTGSPLCPHSRARVAPYLVGSSFLKGVSAEISGNKALRCISELIVIFVSSCVAMLEGLRRPLWHYWAIETVESNYQAALSIVLPRRAA